MANPKTLRVYCDKGLPADRQISAEEMVATLLFDEGDSGLGEGESINLAKRVLLAVLKEFRPDLIVGTPENIRAKQDPLESDPAYPWIDWMGEVENNDTRLGYLDWVDDKRAQLAAKLRTRIEGEGT